MIRYTRTVFHGAFIALLMGLTALAANAQAPEVELVQTPTGEGVAGVANDFYIVERPIRFRMDITATAGTPSVTILEMIVPAGWQFTGVAGADAPDILPLGGGANLQFRWLDTPVLPISFFVEIVVPDTETRLQTINSRVRYVDTAGRPAVTNFVSSTLRRDTARPTITLLGGGITLNCQQPFIDPGVTADDNADGDLTAQVVTAGFVNSNVPGRYVITYNVTDRTGNAAIEARRLVAVLANCPTQQPAGCDNNCAGDPGTDTDSDGLTDCQETCIYGTEVDDPDSDGDGMDDEYEVTFLPTLNPLDPADRNEDADGDTFTNLEEFFRGGSPADASSPQRGFYVAPDGVDSPLRGSRQQPLRTISFAMNQAGATGTAQQRAGIVLLPGLYDTDVTVVPFVTLTGDDGAVVRGTVTLLRDARVERITVEGDTLEDTLVEFNDATTNARARNVILRNASTGIRAVGAGPATCEIDGCTFENLEIGLDIFGAAPKLRRSFFRNIAANSKGFTSAAVIVRATDKQGQFDDEGNLGDTSDPGAGFNTFALPTIEGVAVINERPGLVKIEENDWNTDSEEEIAGAIEGNVDFIPFLGAGSAVFASSLFATVTNAETRERITNATVSVTPGSLTPQATNEDGVYAFPAITEGNYNVTASAPGFDDVTVNAVVNPSELASVLIALGAEDDDEGGCNNGGDKALASSIPGPGAVLTLAFVALVLLAAARRWRRAGS